MEEKIREIAQRIRSLREILEISEEKMAKICHVSVEEYRIQESGQRDFGFTFLYHCANAFGVDIVELITGEKPRLRFYTVVRKGKGLPIQRRQGFTYQHLAYRMQNKLAEPFLVTAPYREEEQESPIELSYHSGQELDYVLSGTLKMQLEEHEEILRAGDAIFYDSGHGHGMIAAEGESCTFLAVVMRDPNAEGEE